VFKAIIKPSIHIAPTFKPPRVQDIAGFSGTLPDESVVDVFGKARHKGGPGEYHKGQLMLPPVAMENP